MYEDAIDERLVELAFSDGSVDCPQGWEVEGPGSETGDEVCAGDAGEGRGDGENEVALISEKGIAAKADGIGLGPCTGRREPPSGEGRRGTGDDVSLPLPLRPLCLRDEMSIEGGGT